MRYHTDWRRDATVLWNEARARFAESSLAQSVSCRETHELRELLHRGRKLFVSQIMSSWSPEACVRRFAAAGRRRKPVRWRHASSGSLRRENSDVSLICAHAPAWLKISRLCRSYKTSPIAMSPMYAPVHSTCSHSHLLPRSIHQEQPLRSRCRSINTALINRMRSMALWPKQPLLHFPCNHKTRSRPHFFARARPVVVWSLPRTCAAQRLRGPLLRTIFTLRALSNRPIFHERVWTLSVSSSSLSQPQTTTKRVHWAVTRENHLVKPATRDGARNTAFGFKCCFAASSCTIADEKDNCTNAR